MDVVALLIFVTALAVIALEWVHRTKVALAGAALVVLVGAIDQDGAIAAVDWATLGLLAGMMVIVGLTEPTGVFTYLALRTGQLSRGNPVALLFLLAGVTGVLSAFLDNLTAIFVSDGYLSRLDGLALVTAWAVATVVVVRTVGGQVAEEVPATRLRGVSSQVVVVLVSLGIVGIGATVAVRSLVDLAEGLGVPEFALAFFGASLGTSAPEIAVDLTALARGMPAIALGDALGSSLIDATLSIGAGPLVAPAEVSPRLGVVGSLYALAAVAIVGTVLAVRRLHDRRSAGVCIALYVLAYAVLVGAD